MESRARLFGHPVHQMLVVFPLGLFGTSVVFDLFHLAGRSDTASAIAYAMIAAGLVGGVLAAPFGLIDWLSVPRGTRAKAIGAMHGGGNAVVLVLLLASWWLRRPQPAEPGAAALALSFIGVGLSLVTAWLGGELVDRLGVGVSPHAHVNARSSLDGPA